MSWLSFRWRILRFWGQLKSRRWKVGFLLCGICVVSPSSTLDSTSKMKAVCFVSSAFCRIWLLQARKQPCCAALRDPQCFCLQALCILHLSIHMACSFCMIPKDTPWALSITGLCILESNHPLIRNTHRKDCISGEQVETLISLAVYTNSFSQVFTLYWYWKSSVGDLQCLRRCAWAWCGFCGMFYEDDFDSSWYLWGLRIISL